MPTERQIADGICAYLRKEGLLYIRARMDKKSTIVEGWPDITVVHAGRAWLCEVKTPTGKLSVKQGEVIGRLRTNGNRVCVATSVEMAVNDLNHWAGIMSPTTDKDDSTAAGGCLKEPSKADHVSTQKGSQADPVTNLSGVGEADPSPERVWSGGVGISPHQAGDSEADQQPRNLSTSGVVPAQSLSEQEKANSVGRREGEHAAGVSAKELFISNFMGIPTVFQRDKDGYHKLLRTATQYDLLHIRER